jgi:hypothetical protein
VRSRIHHRFSATGHRPALDRREIGMAFLLAHLFAALALQAAPAMDSLTGELAAAQAVARTEGERLWPGFGAAPFGMLLVRENRELLLCHPSVPAGFGPAGLDPATGCHGFTRPRSTLAANLLAAMPIFGPPSTIVIGTPEATRLSPARWRATIWHEHFHQWQAALPDYYPRVGALGLAGDDRTGMWMLNFPFPYQRPDVVQAHGHAARALAAALAARGGGSLVPLARRYVALRRAFAQAAGERNWTYFDFQLWQEGVARWTEIAIGRSTSDQAARDEATAREREILAALAEPDLARDGRPAAYALGAGEAMLMEACGADWRTRYRATLALGPLLEDAARECRPQAPTAS